RRGTIASPSSLVEQRMSVPRESLSRVEGAGAPEGVAGNPRPGGGAPDVAAARLRVPARHAAHVAHVAHGIHTGVSCAAWAPVPRSMPMRRMWRMWRTSFTPGFRAPHGRRRDFYTTWLIVSASWEGEARPPGPDRIIGFVYEGPRGWDSKVAIGIPSWAQAG